MKSIKEIIAVGDTMTIYRLLTTYKQGFKKPIEATESEYDPMRHAVMDKMKRKDKFIRVPKFASDGSRLLDRNGNQVYTRKRVPRCRIAIPVQKLICERDVGFLLSNPVTYNIQGDTDERQQSLFNSVMDVFRDNKMDYFDKRLARELFRCCECAELWYVIKGENGEADQMRVMLLSPLKGDKLYPHFDNYHRMDGFAREYYVRDEMGSTVLHFDVYTSSTLYRYAAEQSDGTLSFIDAKPHGFDRIPVVYYRQDETNWNVVQPVIERLEELMSNWGDVNDYFGSPTYFFKGKLKGFAEKGEVGRIYQGDGDSDMKVISWNSAPESMQKEMANLINIIFSYTQTPDISFENMKTLGNNTSGAAIRLMFTDPHLKAETKEELFGEMFTRRFNVVKSGYALTIGAVPSRIADQLRITPVFTPYIPKNEVEMLQLINLSTQSKQTMSQEDGIRLNPLVSNPEITIKEIRKEQQEATKLMLFGTATNDTQQGEE